MCSGGSRTDTGCRPHGPLVGRSLRVREARRHPDGSAAEQPDDTVIEGHGGGGSRTYQPPPERDGVDGEVSDQAQVMVHVLQAAQHLRTQRQKWVEGRGGPARPPTQLMPAGPGGR